MYPNLMEQPQPLKMFPLTSQLENCWSPWAKRLRKNNLIKLINGLLQPDQGRVLINDMNPSPATKAIVAYLPDTTYLNEQMKVKEALTYFKTFYKDFNLERAHHLLADLGIDENSRLKKLSKRE